MKKFLIGLGITVGVLGALLMTVGMYVGTMGPEIHVQYGHEVKDRFLDTIRELDLLEDGEELKYFYSDALLDIKGGMYMLTDRNLILYVKDWNPPAVILPYSQLQAVGADFSDSFFLDTHLSVVDAEDNPWSFPVSSEMDRDHEFHDFLEERIEEEGIFSE